MVLVQQPGVVSSFSAGFSFSNMILFNKERSHIIRRPRVKA